MNPYLNLDYSSFYNFDPEKKTFSDIKDAKIINYAVQARQAAESNQKTKSVLKVKVTKLRIYKIKPFAD